MSKIRTIEIEKTLAFWFGFRSNIIVPNVSWGLGVHECDLLVVSKSGYATEIEIKISKGDLIKDKFKRHGHKGDVIKKLYFAVPEQLEELALKEIPERAGLLVLSRRDYGNGLSVRLARECIDSKLCRALTTTELLQLCRLGTMRIWGLKQRIIEMQNDVNSLKKEVKDN
jgi:hypothetical protein